MRALRRRRDPMRIPVFSVSFLSLFVVSKAAAQSTPIVRVSVASDGSAGIGSSGLRARSAVSRDGRWVAFESEARLVAADTNRVTDVYVHDVVSGATEWVSYLPGGATNPFSSGEGGVAISGDGRFVAFESHSPTLVPGDTNQQFDVFVRDRQTGALVRASVSTAGLEGSAFPSVRPAISGDGRFVTFDSAARTLVPQDSLSVVDVFVRDRDADANGVFDEPASATTTRITELPDGTGFNGDSSNASMSPDGRFVAFESFATNIPGGSPVAPKNVYVHDRTTGLTVCVSRSTSGDFGNSESSAASVSADGRFVSFTSFAGNFSAPDPSNVPDVFVRDRDADGDGAFDETDAASTTCVTLAPNGETADFYSLTSSLSGSGRWIAFSSAASNLTADDGNFATDVFMYDALLGATTRVSRTYDERPVSGLSDEPAMSEDGATVIFRSSDQFLVPNDLDSMDVFAKRFDRSTVERVVPSAGAELGGERVHVFVQGFDATFATEVRFGGAAATVLSTSSTRIDVRSPAGTGSVDVTVSAPFIQVTAPGAYSFVAPDVAARWGSVGVAAGDRQDVLLVNALAGEASSREIVLRLGEPLQGVMIAPAGRSNARFVLYGWARLPDSGTLVRLPGRLGALVLPPPWVAATPHPAVIWNNFGSTEFLGAATLPSSPAPTTVFRRPRGVQRAVDVALQGVIEDDASAIPQHVSVTNAVLLRIH